MFLIGHAFATILSPTLTRPPHSTVRTQQKKSSHHCAPTHVVTTQDENQLSRGFSSLNDLLDGNVAGKSTQVNSGQKIPSSQNWIPPNKAQEWVSFIQNQKMGGGGGSLTCTPKNISPTGPNSKTKSRKTRALAIIGIEKNEIWATWFQGDECNQLWSPETDFPFLMGKWQMLQLVLAFMRIHNLRTVFRCPVAWMPREF
jgi:hypothetical protein